MTKHLGLYVTQMVVLTMNVFILKMYFAFSASGETVSTRFSHLIDVSCVAFIDLHMLNRLYIPGMSPTWSWCIILLSCSQIWFANIWWEFFICIHSISAHSFLVVALSGLAFQVIAVFIEWVWKYSLLHSFSRRVWEGLMLILLWTVEFFS